METITYETNRGNLKTITAERVGVHGHILKTTEGKYIEIDPRGRVTTTVRTRNGGTTERVLGYVA